VAPILVAAAGTEAVVMATPRHSLVKPAKGSISTPLSVNSRAEEGLRPDA
jgi:hypothetical protein